MNTVHVLIDGEPHDIDMSRLTLMFHDGNRKIEIRDPKVFEISPDRTVRFANAILRNEWEDMRAFPEMERLYQLVMKAPIPASYDECNTAQLHVLSLIHI